MTPFELRSLCRSTVTPLKFAADFDGMSEANRRKLSKTAQEIFAEARAKERENFGIPSYEGGLARLALLACCGGSQAKRVKSEGWRGMFPREGKDVSGQWMEALEKIFIARRPAWADEWIAQQLEDQEARWQWLSEMSWSFVRNLMRAGVIRRPEVDGYTRLMALRGSADFDPVRDADLLESDIWRLFAVENVAFKGIPEKRTAAKAREASPEIVFVQNNLLRIRNHWPEVLVGLANDGTIDRGRLIDETLAALWRDLGADFLQFLDYVEVTEEETAAREAAFRELLGHAEGPVIGKALDALKQLHEAGRLDAAEFLKAVPAALGVLDRGRFKSTLSLVDRIVTKAPAERPLAVLAVAPALNHESTEIQDRAVKLLTKWKAADPELDLTAVLTSATSLLGYNRHQLQELAWTASGEVSTGADEEAAGDLDERRQTILARLAALPDWIRHATCLGGLERALEEWELPPAFNPDPAVCPVLSGVEPIEPIRTVDELIDAVAHLFQVIERPEEVERVIDAIMRLGGQTTDDFVAKTAGLCQTEFSTRRGELTTAAILFWTSPNVVRLIGHWLATDFEDVEPRFSGDPGFEAFNQRIAMLIPRYRSKRFGAVLATPTHRGGWIDPRIFVGRIKSLETPLWLVHRFDLIAGLLRLAPDYRGEALAAAADLPPPFGPIVRYALGGDDRPTEFDQERADEWLAAGRARHPRGTLEDLKPLGLDEREPDGITRAVYRFRPSINLEVYAANTYSRHYGPPCVEVTPQVFNSASLETRPTVGLAAALIKESELRGLQAWQAELLASFWPLNTDAALAIACCKLVSRINLSGTYGHPTEAWMTSLHAVDRGWSEMARTALWLAAASRNDRLRGTAVDALIEGIADGRARPGTLAETLLHVASGGWLTLTRLAEALREVARTSVLAERIVAEILDRLIASWTELPRDGHAILALQLGLLSNLRQATSQEARAVLAQVKGSGKAAKLAKQLCRFETDDQSAAVRQAVLDATEGRIARAERIWKRMKAEG
jgi:Family of unknown function (DUF6493)